MKKIISVSTRKGGVGKTTMANNFAYELSINGFKVLLIDLDDQCDLTKLTCEEVNKEKNILGVMKNLYSLSEAATIIYDKFYVVSGHKDAVDFKSYGKKNILKQKLADQTISRWWESETHV